MFRRILIANRGDIAARIGSTCRDLGIETVAVYEEEDRGSLHVRLADRCVALRSPRGFFDVEEVLRLARESEADAIHPGYGFLAENAEFVEACEAAGIAFVGPPADVVRAVHDRPGALARARAAGHATLEASPIASGPDASAALRREAARIGWPVAVKSVAGGRGRGERLARGPETFEEAFRRASAEARKIYGDDRMYVERAAVPAHILGVQVLSDEAGATIQLGEREGSVIFGNQKILEETPAPCLDDDARAELHAEAIAIAELFGLRGASTVEFLRHADGSTWFTEIKPRIQMPHPVTELVTHVDLVREQIRVAAGLPLSDATRRAVPHGHAIQCRVNAEDPRARFRPTPGRLRTVRMPSGPGVRVDTYVYAGCDVPARYDSVVAKIAVWGSDREHAIGRLRRALRHVEIVGTPTNLPLLQRIAWDDAFHEGRYDTELLAGPVDALARPGEGLRGLAAAAAFAWSRRNEAFDPVVPDRMRSGWNRSRRAKEV
ncbi:MAG TPA: biotin carboxylase N-terminal domain-containing protein [Candidatus Polarisedimenticolaceae bacterium]